MATTITAMATPFFLKSFMVVSAPQLHQLLLELALDAAQFHLGLLALLGTVLLDLDHLVQSGDELLVGVLKGLDVDDAALGLLGGGHGAHVQHLGVFAQQLVGHIGHGGLRRGGLTGTLQTEGEHHLALPERDGVDQRGLDFLDHHGVVVLQ